MTMRRLAAFALPSVLLLAAAPVFAQKATKIAITPQSERAAIILRSPAVQPPNATYKTSYRLGLDLYDPLEQRIRSGPLSGSATIAARPDRYFNGFLFIDLKPGTYVVSTFNRQDFWTLCYQDDTVQFTVKPGEVLYLGYFDARVALAELSRKAVLSGQTSTRGKPVQFFDNVSAPPFLPITDEGLAAARVVAKAAMPRTTVEPTAAVLSPARFGTGSALIGGRMCTGYFPTKAK